MRAARGKPWRPSLSFAAAVRARLRARSVIDPLIPPTLLRRLGSRTNGERVNSPGILTRCVRGVAADRKA